MSLKEATNAPGLKPDRQSASYSYGAVFMLGFNNINFGYAIGRDHVFALQGNPGFTKIRHGRV